jgi:hypothetical protein
MPKLGWLLLGLDGLRPQACPKSKKEQARRASPRCYLLLFFFFKKKRILNKFFTYFHIKIY